MDAEDVIAQRRDSALESGICAGGCGAELSADRIAAHEEMCDECQPPMAVSAADPAQTPIPPATRRLRRTISRAIPPGQMALIPKPYNH